MPNFLFCIRLQSHTKQLLDEIKSTKEETEELADKLKQKATLHAKLVDEFEKNNRNLNRFECFFFHMKPREKFTPK